MEAFKSMTLTCIILFLFYVVSSFMVLTIANQNDIRVKQNINTSVRVM